MDYTKLLYEGKDIEHDPCYAHPKGIFLWHHTNTYDDIIKAMKQYKKTIVENEIHDFYETLTFQSMEPISGKGIIHLSYSFYKCYYEEHVLTECMHYEIIQYRSLEKKRQRKN